MYDVTSHLPHYALTDALVADDFVADNLSANDIFMFKVSFCQGLAFTDLTLFPFVRFLACCGPRNQSCLVRYLAVRRAVPCAGLSAILPLSPVSLYNLAIFCSSGCPLVLLRHQTPQAHETLHSSTADHQGNQTSGVSSITAILCHSEGLRYHTNLLTLNFP